MWQVWSANDSVQWLKPLNNKAQLDDAVVAARMHRSSDAYEPYDDCYLSLLVLILRNASYCKIDCLVPHDEEMTGPQPKHNARAQRLGGMIPGFDVNSGWVDDWQHRESVGDVPLQQWPMISHRYARGHVQHRQLQHNIQLQHN